MSTAHSVPSLWHSACPRPVSTIPALAHASLMLSGMGLGQQSHATLGGERAARGWGAEFHGQSVFRPEESRREHPGSNTDILPHWTFHVPYRITPRAHNAASGLGESVLSSATCSTQGLQALLAPRLSSALPCLPFRRALEMPCLWQAESPSPSRAPESSSWESWLGWVLNVQAPAFPSTSVLSTTGL